MWVDDPHFNPGYHVRHTALPEPASLEQLRNLTGRVLAQRLDRTKPLWEIWLVQRVEGGRFAMISKTHHCLVDGVSGVDIATVLFDLEPEPAAPARAPAGRGSRGPSRARRRWSPTRSPSARSTPMDAMRARPRCDRAPRAGGGAARQGRGGDRRDAAAGPPGRAPEPVQRADRPAPPVRVDRRRPRPVQGDQDGAGRHRQRRRPERRGGRAAHPHAGQRPRGRRRRAQGDGADVRARRGRARRARQPGDGDVRAAAGLRRRPGRALPDRPRGDEGAQGVRPGRRRRSAHPARRLRPADGALAGVAAAVRASACSTSS